MREAVERDRVGEWMRSKGEGRKEGETVKERQTGGQERWRWKEGRGSVAAVNVETEGGREGDRQSRRGEKGDGTTDGLDKKRREIGGRTERENRREGKSDGSMEALKPGLSLAEIQETAGDWTGDADLRCQAYKQTENQRGERLISKCAGSSNTGEENKKEQGLPLILRLSAMETYSTIAFLPSH